MQKMFFNPSYLRFKRLGASHLTSVALAMGVVFVVSWALHAYQWFWLSGTTLFTLPDMLFWGILAVFMVAQTFYEARPRKQSSANTGARAMAISRAFLVVRIACTFLSLCLLWSFWTSPTVSAWLDLLARSELVPALTEPGAASAAQWIATLAFTALVIVMVAITAGVSFGLAPPAASQTRKRPPAASGTPAFLGSVGLSSALVCGILALQVPAINSAFGSGVQRIASDISVQKLNGADEVMMERGYYEGLTTDNRFNPELWDFFSTRSRITSNDAGSTVPGMRLRDDYLGRDYVPNSVFTISGVGTPINRWGFPDQDYTLEKPPGTYRIAMIEASRALGAGVKYADRFETLLEQRLNSETVGSRYKRYEILNFSVDGYMPMERLLFFEERGLQFRPDAALYIAGIRDTNLLHHAQMIRKGVAMPFDFVESIHRKAGIQPSMSEAEIVRRLQPYRYELVSNVYRRLIEKLREQGAIGIWTYLPLVSKVREDPADIAELTRLAKAAGFVTFDTADLFVSLKDWSAYRLSRWDSHPNERGHLFISNVFYDRLKTLQEEGRIDMGLRRAGVHVDAPTKRTMRSSEPSSLPSVAR